MTNSVTIKRSGGLSLHNVSTFALAWLGLPVLDASTKDRGTSLYTLGESGSPANLTGIMTQAVDKLAEKVGKPVRVVWQRTGREFYSEPTQQAYPMPVKGDPATATGFILQRGTERVFRPKMCGDVNWTRVIGSLLHPEQVSMIEALG